MEESAKVEMKGPSAWKAAIRTHLDWSLRRLTKRGESSYCRTAEEQTQESGMKTSAHAFRTPQTSSSHRLKNFLRRTASVDSDPTTLEKSPKFAAQTLRTWKRGSRQSRANRSRNSFSTMSFPISGAILLSSATASVL